MLSADRPSTALESEEALETIQALFKVMEDTIEAHTKYSVVDKWDEVNKHANHLHSNLRRALQERSQAVGEAIRGRRFRGGPARRFL